MADDQTTEELTRAMIDLKQAIKDGKTIDPKEVNKLDKALQNASRGAQTQTTAQKSQTEALGKSSKNTTRFAAAVGGTTRNLGRFATNVSAAAIDIQNNQESFSSLNGSIDLAAGLFKTTGKLVGGVGDAVGTALSAIPLLGPVIGGLVSGVSKATAALAEATADTAATIAKQVTAQLDNAGAAMQLAGQSGAIAGKGLTGLFDQAIQAGLSVKDFAGVLKTNGEGLAFAFGNATKGAEMLARTSDAMRPFRRELEALGIGAKQQNEITANYIKLQSRTGSLEGRSARELAAGSADYAKRLTTLARLTGKSVDVMQKELDAQMSNARMVGAMAEATAKFGPKAADKMAGTAASISALLGDDIGKGIQDSLAGNFATQNAQLIATTGGQKAVKAVQMLRDNQISQAEATAMIIKGFQETGKAMGGSGTLGSIAGLGTVIEGGILPMQKALALVGKSSADIAELINKTKSQASALDPATKGLVDGKNAMRSAAEEVNKIMKDQLPMMGAAAVTVANTMTNAMKEINKMINMGAEKYAKSMLQGPNSDEMVEKQDAANEKYMTGMEKVSSGMAKGIEFLVGGFSKDLENKLQASRVMQQTKGGMAEGRFGAEGVVEGFKLEKRALGGPVSAGESYMVGESGPEMLTMGSMGGMVTPNAGPAGGYNAMDLGGLQSALGGNNSGITETGAASAMAQASNTLAEAQINRLDALVSTMSRSLSVQAEILEATRQ